MSAEKPTLARRYINNDPDVGQEEAYNSVCDLEAEVESWEESNAVLRKKLDAALERAIEAERLKARQPNRTCYICGKPASRGFVFCSEACWAASIPPKP